MSDSFVGATLAIALNVCKTDKGTMHRAPEKNEINWQYHILFGDIPIDMNAQSYYY
ncbi:hypothetical protein ACFL60_06270 [Candidatus Omnitrophota bacterium]